MTHAEPSPLYFIGHRDGGANPAFPGCVPGFFVYSRAYPDPDSAGRAMESVLSMGWTDAYVFEARQVAHLKKRNPQ